MKSWILDLIHFRKLLYRQRYLINTYINYLDSHNEFLEVLLKNSTLSEVKRKEMLRLLEARNRHYRADYDMLEMTEQYERLKKPKIFKRETWYHDLPDL